MSNDEFFQETNIPELLGLTPVSMVSDREIWQHLGDASNKGDAG